MDSTIVQISILLTLIAAFNCYLLIRLPHKHWIKWLLIPLVLGTSLWLSQAIPDLMGRAKPGPPHGQFVYLGHQVEVGKKGDKRIDLWVQQKKETRLYSVPFNPQLSQELDDAKKASQSGTVIKGHLETRKGTGGSAGVLFDLKIDPKINMQTILPPKDNAPNSDGMAVEHNLPPIK
jgi:hypothetical protein